MQSLTSAMTSGSISLSVTNCKEDRKSVRIPAVVLSSMITSTHPLELPHVECCLSELNAI